MLNPDLEFFYADAEKQAQKNVDDALEWRRSFNNKELELQQVQLEAQNILATAQKIRDDADLNLAQGFNTVKKQQEQLVLKDTELKALHESLEPLLDMIPEAEEEGALPILERIKSPPNRLGKYINDMAQMIVKNLLSTIRVHMP